MARARSRWPIATPTRIIKPQYAIDRLYELTTRRDDVYVTTEVGQHQMWAAQRFHFEEPNRWMTVGGLGTMGYGLPAAVGVQMAHPDALVIDIAGEASVQMTMQEMSTAMQYDLPIKIFILNNEYMGMVRQWQEMLHGGRYSHSYSEALPDFVKMAEAFGCVGLRADKPAELDDKIQEMIDSQAGRCCSTAASIRPRIAIPMIPSGAAHNEMILSTRTTAARSATPERCWSEMHDTKVKPSDDDRAPHPDRAGGQRGRRAGARGRPVLRPRLQYRKPDGGRGRSRRRTPPHHHRHQRHARR